MIPKSALDQSVESTIKFRKIDPAKLAAMIGYGKAYGFDETLKAAKEGGEVFEFITDNISWECMAGRAGICVRRDGKCVAYFYQTIN